LPNSSRYYCVTCDKKSNSVAGKCKIGKMGKEKRDDSTHVRYYTYKMR